MFIPTKYGVISAYKPCKECHSDTYYTKGRVVEPEREVTIIFKCSQCNWQKEISWDKFRSFIKGMEEHIEKSKPIPELKEKANELHNLRIKSRKTLQQVVEGTGLDLMRVSKIECAKVKPTDIELKKLNNYYQKQENLKQNDRAQ